MNKKGDIPSIILIIAAGALVITGAVIFALFNGELAARSGDYASLMNQLEFNYQYALKNFEMIIEQAGIQCSSCDENQFKEKIIEIAAIRESQFRYENLGNAYGKIRSGEFTVQQKENELQVIIEDLFVKAESGNNLAIRSYSFAREVDI